VGSENRSRGIKGEDTKGKNMRNNLLETLNLSAKQWMEDIEEEKNGYPKNRAKIQALISQQPEERRKEITELLLPMMSDGRWARVGYGGELIPLNEQ
jgi:uncharacterized protein YgiM (DUF1202 family)